MEDEQQYQEKQIKDVSLILKDLLKVIKVVSMYPEDNPLPQSLRQSFSEKLCGIVDDYGDIPIEVRKEELLLGDTVVFHDKNKDEGLAAIFFDTGVTSFTFKSGFDCVGVYRLLDAIKKYLNTPGKTADMASLLWEADISCFAFTTAQDIELADFDGQFNVQESGGAGKDSGGIRRSVFGYDNVETYGRIFESKDSQNFESNEVSLTDSSEVREVDLDEGRPSGPAQGGAKGGRTRGSSGPISRSGQRGQQQSGAEALFSVDPGESSELRIAELVSALGIDDLNSQAAASPAKQTPKSHQPDAKLILNDQFKLSEEESETITGLLRDDAEFDDYESTVEILKEMLLQEPQMQDFYETVGICEKIMSEFISLGKLVHAGQMLAYLKELDQRIRNERPLWAERLKDAVVTAGSRERLKKLTQALNENPNLGALEIKKYLEQFGWEALGGLSDMMAELSHSAHQETVGEFLSRLGRKHVEIVAKGIHEKRPEAVRGAITVLTQIGTDAAISYAKHAMKHADEFVRLHLIQSLNNCESPKVIEILCEAAQDESSIVRSAAVASLILHKGEPALNAITEILNSERFAQLDRQDQQELMNAYSILGEERAVPYLMELAKQFDLTHDASVQFFREAAFEALAKNESEEAGRALVTLARSWRGGVRNQAKEAIQRRREYLYGGVS